MFIVVATYIVFQLCWWINRHLHSHKVTLGAKSTVLIGRTVADFNDTFLINISSRCIWFFMPCHRHIRWFSNCLIAIDKLDIVFRVIPIQQAIVLCEDIDKFCLPGFSLRINGNRNRNFCYFLVLSTCVTLFRDRNNASMWTNSRKVRGILPACYQIVRQGFFDTIFFIGNHFFWMCRQVYQNLAIFDLFDSLRFKVLSYQVISAINSTF